MKKDPRPAARSTRCFLVTEVDPGVMLPAERMVRRALPYLLSLILAGTAAQAANNQASTHTVADGQRLGSIAKRYGVSIDALCQANGIDRRAPIRPGQRLTIPGRLPERGSAERPAPEADSARAEGPAIVHRVEAGQRLESIARRYRVSVGALCEENRFDRRSLLRPGQLLRIPGSAAPAPAPAPAGRSSSRGPYARTPAKRGYVELVGHTRRFRGHVLDKRGQLLPKAKREIARLLGVSENGPRLDDRLVRSLVEVSDHFGGRPLRIVSGYRSNSYFKDSRHKASRAVDFSVLGVPNEVVRDYLRTFNRVGVGYYPNSSFVHLDVREYAAYWVDYSRPGEAPRRSPSRRAEPQQDLHDEEPGANPTPTPVLAVAGARPTPPPETLPAPVRAGVGELQNPGTEAPLSTQPVRALRPAPARALIGRPRDL
jgi:LysM repeat protein